MGYTEVLPTGRKPTNRRLALANRVYYTDLQEICQAFFLDFLIFVENLYQ